MYFMGSPGHGGKRGVTQEFSAINPSRAPFRRLVHHYVQLNCRLHHGSKEDLHRWVRRLETGIREQGNLTGRTGEREPSCVYGANNFLNV